VLQETVAGFEVRCCASQSLHHARCGVHSCVQAAAAARVAGGPDILHSVQHGDGVSVLCHVIADADAVNKQAPFFSRRTPLHWSAENGHLEICRLLLHCKADVNAEAFE
jgi:ankyrin repeat protein